MNFAGWDCLFCVMIFYWLADVMVDDVWIIIGLTDFLMSLIDVYKGKINVYGEELSKQ